MRGKLIVRLKSRDCKRDPGLDQLVEPTEHYAPRTARAITCVHSYCNVAAYF